MRKLLIIFIILLLITFLVSCGDKDMQTETMEYINLQNAEKIISDDVQQLLNNDYIDEEIKELIRASADRDVPETNYQKIQKAAQKGVIDREEEVLLTLKAAFVPEKLPEEYNGAAYGNGEVSLKSEIQWLINHRDELDEETKAFVKPFIVPADDPESYFNPINEEKSENILENLSLIKRAEAAGPQWTKKDISINGFSGKIILYYRQQGLSSDEKDKILEKVDSVQEALNDAWEKHRELLNIQPSHDIGVYLTNKFDDCTDGEAVYYTGNDDVIDYYEIRLKESLQNKMLKSAVAHELFHCFQYEIGLTYFDKSKDLDWLTEATAVWSENYVYNSYNREQMYLDEFFGSLNCDMLSVMNTKEYASYVLFYFLTDFYGDKNYIPQIIYAARDVKSSMDIRGMLMREIEDIKDVYGEFALYNWNTKPYKKYTDKNGFTDTIPYGDSRETYELNSPEKKEYSALMERGGILYQKFIFTQPPEEIKWVRFDFENEASNISEYVKRQAFIKIGSEWTLENWTDKKYKEFCRRKDFENVKCVVLISSNANFNEGAYYDFTVNTKGDCPMKGYTKIIFEGIAGADNMGFNFSSEMFSEDEIFYCPVCDAFVLKNRNATFNSLKSVMLPNPFSEGGDMFTQKCKGKGSIGESYSEEDQYWRLSMSDDGTKVTLNLFPETKETNWITYTGSGVENNVEQGKLPSFSIGKVEFENGKKTYTASTGEKITQNCIINENVIKGNLTVQTVEEMGSGKYTIEFEYDISPLNNQ